MSKRAKDRPEKRRNRDKNSKQARLNCFSPGNLELPGGIPGLPSMFDGMPVKEEESTNTFCPSPDDRAGSVSLMFYLMKQCEKTR